MKYGGSGWLFWGATIAACYACLRYMMNDILTSIFIYLILQHIDFLLGKLLRTTIDLEDQVQERCTESIRTMVGNLP